MEMRFDPMTGKPIEPKTEPESTPGMKFDPMTGEPVQPKAEPESTPGTKFDPMTGKPVQPKTEPESTPGMKFDPMTGEPVQPKAEPESTPGMKFDPMTGEPVQSKAEPGSALGMKFDPMTGAPIQSNTGAEYNAGMNTAGINTGTGKKKKGKFAAILGVVAAILCCCVVAFAGVKSGAFLGPSGKVALAVSNTFTDIPEVAENMKGINLLNEKAYTVSVDGKAESNSINVTYSSKTNEKQFSGKINVEDTPEISFLAGIDKNKVKAEIPLLGNKLFIYDYHEEKSGYLKEQLGSDTLDAIDKACETVFSQKEQKNQTEKLAKILTKQYKDLKFKSVGKDSFEVNGKDRKCKGYQVTVTEDTMKDFVDALDDFASEELGDIYDQADVREAFNELRDGFDGMPDMDITFYIYKGKLACVSFEVQGDELQLLFKGGKTRTQNMELKADGETLMELEGEVSGKTEKSRLYVDGDKVLEMEYNAKTGDYELDLTDDVRISGTLKTDRKGFEFSIRGDDISGTVTIKKGAEIEKYSGEEFDIGNASESDIYGLVSEMQDMESY